MTNKEILLNAQETLENLNGTMCIVINELRAHQIDQEIHDELCLAHDHIINAIDWVNSYIDEIREDAND